MKNKLLKNVKMSKGMNNNEVYERWKSFGFLAGLNDADAHTLAERFEELAHYLLDTGLSGNIHVSTMAFPTLRKSFMRGLGDNYSPAALCDKIKKDYDVETRKIKSKAMGYVDAEAKFCAILADYFSRDKNKKKR